MRNPCKTNKQNYNKIRNKNDRMIKTKQQLPKEIKLDQHRCNLRETWKVINNLLGKKTTAKFRDSIKWFIGNGQSKNS